MRQYRLFISVGAIAMVIGIAAILSTGIRAQTSPETDPCTIRQDIDGEFRIEIFSNNGVITYRETDLTSQAVLSEVVASQAQILHYTNNCDGVSQETSQQSLQGNEGVHASVWVGNRVPELQSCQDDMQTGQGFDFALLGAGGQNQTIARMQECIELNSRVNRITIQNLLDVLIAEGILE